MNIDEKELRLLLERNKNKIGYRNPDTLISGISMLLSVIAGSYTNILGIKGIYIKWFAIRISLYFIVKGVISMWNKYTYDDLYVDVKSLDKTEHPHSLIAIKDTFKEHSNRFLLYYDESWGCWLFPNFKSKDFVYLSNHLANMLKTDVVSMVYSGEDLHAKHSYKDNITKVYKHTLYSVEIVPTQTISKNSFEIDGIKFKWQSIADMKKDPIIKERNLEVVNFVDRSIA